MEIVPLTDEQIIVFHEKETIKDLIVKNTNAHESVISLQVIGHNFVHSSNSLEKLVSFTPKSAMISDAEGQKVFSAYLQYLLDIQKQCRHFKTEVIKIRSTIELVVSSLCNMRPFILNLLKDENKRLDSTQFSKTIEVLQTKQGEILELKQSLDKIFKEVGTISDSKAREAVTLLILSDENLKSLSGFSDNMYEKKLEEVSTKLAEDESNLINCNSKKNVIKEEIFMLEKQKSAIIEEEKSVLEQEDMLRKQYVDQVNKFGAGMPANIFKQEMDKIQNTFNTNLELVQKNYQNNIDRITKSLSDLLDPMGQVSTQSSKFHFIFVLDESGSMSSDWSAVIKCFNTFVNIRSSQHPEDLLTVILFDDKARCIRQKMPITKPPSIPNLRAGGTDFNVAVEEIWENIVLTPSDCRPVVLFLTDGSGSCTSALNRLTEMKNRFSAQKFMFFAIAFGNGADKETLKKMINSANGSEYFKVQNQNFSYLHSAIRYDELEDVFNTLSSLVNVDKANLLETQRVLTAQITEEWKVKELQEEAHERTKVSQIKNLNSLKDRTSSAITKVKEAEKKAISAFKPQKNAIDKRKTLLNEKLNKYQENLLELDRKIGVLTSSINALKNEQTLLTAQIQSNINVKKEKIQNLENTRLLMLKKTGFSEDKDFIQFNDLRGEGEKVTISLQSVIKSTQAFIEQVHNQVADIILSLTGKREGVPNNFFDELVIYWNRKNNMQLPNNRIEAMKTMCQKHNTTVFTRVKDLFHDLEIDGNNLYILLTAGDGDKDKVMEKMIEKTEESWSKTTEINELEKEQEELDQELYNDETKKERKNEIRKKKDNNKIIIAEHKNFNRAQGKLVKEYYNLIYATLFPLVSSVMNPRHKLTLALTISSAGEGSGLFSIASTYNEAALLLTN